MKQYQTQFGFQSKPKQLRICRLFEVIFNFAIIFKHRHPESKHQQKCIDLLLLQAGMFNKKIQFFLSKIYVFISQVNHKKQKVLPILYCLFICSQNNRRLHWCRWWKLVLSWLAKWKGYHIPEKREGKYHISSG